MLEQIMMSDEVKKKLNDIHVAKDKYDKIYDICKTFIDEHTIYDGECVVQRDNPSIESPYLVAQILDVIDEYSKCPHEEEE